MTFFSYTVCKDIYVVEDGVRNSFCMKVLIFSFNIIRDSFSFLYFFSSLSLHSWIKLDCKVFNSCSSSFVKLFQSYQSKIRALVRFSKMLIWLLNRLVRFSLNVFRISSRGESSYLVICFSKPLRMFILITLIWFKVLFSSSDLISASNIFL